MTLRSSGKTIVVCVAALMLMLIPALSSAQTPATSSGLRSGDLVWVTSSGSTTKGRVSNISPEAIAVIVRGQPTTFKRADIQRLERQVPDSLGDGLGTGAAIGALAGAVVGLVAGLGSDSNGFGAIADGPLIGAMGGAVVGAVFGMPTGLVIDAFHHGREPVEFMRAPQIQLHAKPTVTPQRLAVGFTVRW